MKIQNFHSRKRIWNYRLRNGSHFGQGEMSFNRPVSHRKQKFLEYLSDLARSLVAILVVFFISSRLLSCKFGWYQCPRKRGSVHPTQSTVNYIVAERCPGDTVSLDTSSNDTDPILPKYFGLSNFDVIKFFSAFLLCLCLLFFHWHFKSLALCQRFLFFCAILDKDYPILSYPLFLAGQERFSSMTRVYYRDSQAGVIMFDLSRRSTFLNVAKWKKDLDEKCRQPDGSTVPCILLANKVSNTRKQFTILYPPSALSVSILKIAMN